MKKERNSKSGIRKVEEIKKKSLIAKWNNFKKEK